MPEMTDDELIELLRTYRLTDAEPLQWRWECEYGTAPPAETITLDFLPEQNAELERPVLQFTDEGLARIREIVDGLREKWRQERMENLNKRNGVMQDREILYAPFLTDPLERMREYAKRPLTIPIA